MKVKVYILEEALDLFEDEKIEITQKLNDIEKLSNIFTDFTNSFTIPSSAHNNKVMKHFYNPDIVNGYNLSIRIDGFIEIDSLPFKFGQWQLEECIMKDGLPESYKITFYSKTSQLSKLFGNDTIDQLDYLIVNDIKTKPFSGLSQFDYAYNETNTLDSLNDPAFKGGNLITPLIAYTDRIWRYGTNNALDISNASYPILDNELRPALKVIKIIESIETKYGITFTRDFFGDAFFNKLFLWMNQRTDNVASIQFYTGNITTALSPISPYINDGSFTLTSNTITATSTAPQFYQIQYKIIPTDLTLPYDAKLVYENGNDVISNSQNNISNVTGINFLTFNNILNINEPGVTTNKIQIQISPKFTNTFNIEVTARKDTGFLSGVVITAVESKPNNNTLNADVKVEDSLPKMKVLDFIQGIMKMFKLIIRPLSATNFYIDTLDNFYNGGNILDITKYVDVDTVTITRPTIYNKIEFLFQKTENILGKNFRDTNDPINNLIGYGDLKSTYPQIADTNELKVELPFENMLFERLTIQQPNVNAGDGTNICIGESYSLNQDQITVSKNNSKPILFFNNDIADITVTPLKFKFNTSSSIQTLNSIYNIGNTDNIDLSGVTQSINWGNATDPWHLTNIPQSLYKNFWDNWIKTIYSIKQRKFNFKAILPPRYITELSLNDRLIIGNNRYKINDYTIDLVTGEADLNLFNDIY